MRTRSSSSPSVPSASSRGRRVPSARRARLLSVAAVLALAACGPTGGGADAGPAFAPTFTNVNAQVLAVGCAISPCHQPPLSNTTNGNLDLKTDPYTALLGDGGVPATDVGAPYNYHYNGMPLVTPGDPEHSLLYLKISAGAACSPVIPQGTSCPYGQHMPNLSGQTLSPSVVESVREWIADGAKND